MARPPRKEQPSRQIVYVRMSPDEIRQLDQRKPQGMSRSEYLRRRGLNRRTEPQRIGEAQIVSGLGNIGNNLNQLARALNALRREGRASVGDTEIEELQEQLARLSDVSDEIRSQILNRGDTDDAGR